jgi:hypothetical protein
MLLFYDEASGLVRRFLHSGDGTEDAGPWIEVNAAAGPMMAEVTDPWSVYVWQGAAHPLPPKPGDWATFDPATATWLDQRSAAQRAADLELAKATAIARVNGWAARERGRHITAIPGQDMIYLAKEAEALRWLAADPPPVDLTGYPLLAAEVGITAETPDQLAQLWVHLGQIWRGLAAGIETTRLGTIKAITEAGDEDGVSAALATLPDAG